jgi:hypothetical protein
MHLWPIHGISFHGPGRRAGAGDRGGSWVEHQVAELAPTSASRRRRLVILSGGTGTGGPVDTTIKIGVGAPLAAPGRYRFVR